MLDRSIYKSFTATENRVFVIMKIRSTDKYKSIMNTNCACVVCRKNPRITLKVRRAANLLWHVIIQMSIGSDRVS